MTNSINEAIAGRSAHDLAEALAEHGVSAARSGALHSDDEACELDGFGTIFFRDSGWVCECPVDNDELADELADIVDWSQRIS